MMTPLIAGLPIKAIIFDCDGTLVDNEGAHLSAWQKTLLNRGHVLTPEQLLLYAGKSDAEIAKLCSKIIDCNCKDELLAEKNSHYHKLQEQSLPSIENTVVFLKQIANEKTRLGLKLGIASAAMKSEILSNLKNLGVEDLFDVILSGHDDLKNYVDLDGVNKPKPYIYLDAMKKLGVFPAQCVAIEDSTTGVRAAVSAGCFTVAVPNVYTRNQDLSSAHLCLESFLDISIDDFLQKVGVLNEKINNKITNVILVQDTYQQSQSRQRRYIITGGPGSGKTFIINKLAEKGYLIVREAATDIIKEGLQQNFNDPWMADDYHIKVSNLMAERQKEVENSPETIVFFDRGHLDGITYILLQRRKLPQEVVDYVQSTMAQGFFDKMVFLIENLGFCEQAPNRTESLEEALEKSRHIKQNYQSLGYEVIVVPPGTIEQGSEWIIKHIQQQRLVTEPKLPLVGLR